MQPPDELAVMLKKKCGSLAVGSLGFLLFGESFRYEAKDCVSLRVVFGSAIYMVIG